MAKVGGNTMEEKRNLWTIETQQKTDSRGRKMAAHLSKSGKADDWRKKTKDGRETKYIWENLFFFGGGGGGGIKSPKRF